MPIITRELLPAFGRNVKGGYAAEVLRPQGLSSAQNVNLKVSATFE
jgi:hypothetical protein